MPWGALRGAIIMGFAALALQGGPLAWIALVGGVGAMLPLAGWRPLQHSTVWGWFTAAVLGGLFVAAWFGMGANIGLGALLAYLQVHRRITGRGRADDRISLLLAALMLVASAGAGSGPAFLAVVVAWACCVPMALMPTSTRWPTALAHAGVVVAVGLAVFVLAPRPRHTDVGGERIELTGFASHVELGDLDQLLQDPGVVFRARFPEPQVARGRVYWRGVALDAFDGTRWTATLPPAAVMDAPVPTGPSLAQVEVVREPSADGTLFVPGRVVHVEVDEVPLARDPHGAWFVRETGARIRYRATVSVPVDASDVVLPEERAGDPVLTRSLQLPGPLRADLESWAEPLAGDGAPLAQVEALAAHLRTSYRYSRNAPARSDTPLRSFLFEQGEGHCEYFASALAVLARTRGVPARVVNGFVTEDIDEDGWVTVRKHHAHAWVEVHVAGDGWRIVDATPGPGAPGAGDGWAASWEALQRWWLDAFLAYDGERQRQAVRAVPERSGTTWLGLLAVVALVGGGIGWALATLVTRWWPRLRGGPRERGLGRIARIHARTRRTLAARGIRFPAGLPPVAAAEWYASTHSGPSADALHALAWLVYDTELGGTPPETVLRRARGLARQAVATTPR